LERPSGCVYNTRCQEVIGPRCAAEVPAFHNVDADHFAACHLYDAKEGAA
jgi:peptide/nickel transport system ATP-binding protein